MVNIETKKIVDLVVSRDLGNVIEWLRSYPNLEIVSRYASQAYAAAIRQAHLKVTQVSNRFHLLKNLTDYCKSFVTKTLNFKVKIKRLPCDSDKKNTNIETSNKKSIRIKETQYLDSLGLSEKDISLQLKMDIRTVNKYINLDIDKLAKDAQQKSHEENVSQKEKNINTVCSLKECGYGVMQITRIMGISKQTIRRYINPTTTSVHGSYGVPRESTLAIFDRVIDELIVKG